MKLCTMIEVCELDADGNVIGMEVRSIGFVADDHFNSITPGPVKVGDILHIEGELP